VAQIGTIGVQHFNHQPGVLVAKVATEILLQLRLALNQAMVLAADSGHGA